MEENTIRKYAELMRELGLTGLEIKENGCEVRLERQLAAALPTLAAPLPEAPAQAAPAQTAASPAAGYKDITSPMVGVFYCAPAENAKPYVKVGDTVKRGDILCIIEAMKLMNEIPAEEDGVIVEVCVGNGQVVDCGHVMFRMKKASA